MQFDRDMSSDQAELFLEVRDLIMKGIEGMNLEAVERYRPNITSYFCEEYKSGFCYLRTKEDYVHIGWFQGVHLKDPEHLLFGNGKIIRGEKVYRLDETQKRAISSYLEQTHFILLEKREQQEMKNSLKGRRGRQ